MESGNWKMDSGGLKIGVASDSLLLHPLLLCLADEATHPAGSFPLRWAGKMEHGNGIRHTVEMWKMDGGQADHPP